MNTDHTASAACTLLATRCACCGRKLTDAISVETAVGPVCRKEHGFDTAEQEPNWTALHALHVSETTFEGAPAIIKALASEDARSTCNVLTRWVAVYGRDEAKLARVEQAVKMMNLLGFVKLSAKVADRLLDEEDTEEEDTADRDTSMHVRVERLTACIKVRGPFHMPLIDALKLVPGRKYDRIAQANVFPLTAAQQIFLAIKKGLPVGSKLISAKGVTVLLANPCR